MTMERMSALKTFSHDRVYLMETQVEMETAPIFSRSDAQAVRRRPWGSRRRTRSTGSIPFFWQHKRSDDSSSSIGPDNKGLSSMYQSDSDDVSGRQTTMFNLQSRKPSHLLGNLESDSVNENFSPIRPNTRRKRKFKRMAVDIEMASTSSRPPVCIMTASGKKKRVLRHIPNCDSRFCRGVAGATCGKRKRSVRTDNQRSMNIDSPQVFSSPLDTATPTTALHRLSIRDPQPQSTAEIPAPSNSSLSSSESDTGIFTNDEGREGDDEQSDWFGEAGAVGGAGTGGKGWWEDSDRDEDMEPTFQALLTGSLDQMSDKAKRTYRMLADRMGHGGREIRGGRRRVRAEKPGFSVLTSANEKLSRFLQDPAQSELRLHPMQKREREQLCHLADLYSLNMSLAEPSKKGLTCPVLTKTSNTVRVEHVSLARFNTLCDCRKRRRKVGPSGHFSSPPELEGNSTDCLRPKLMCHKSS